MLDGREKLLNIAFQYPGRTSIVTADLPKEFTETIKCLMNTLIITT